MAETLVAAPPARAEGLLVGAQFVTCLGNGIQLTASALLVVRETPTTLSVGWLYIAVAVPQVLLSLVFGRLADRFDRRRLCLWCSVASAVLAAALPAWLLAGGPASVAAYTMNFALAAVTALFMPASNALIKERVVPERLAGFNAHYEMATQAGLLLSTAAGGFLVAWLGVSPVLLFNAATFVAVAGLLWAMGEERVTAEEHGPLAGGGLVRAPLRRLGVLYALGNMIITVSNALLVVLVIEVYRQGPGVLGLLDAAAGAGMFFAAVLFKRLITRVGGLAIALAGYAGCAVLTVGLPLLGVAAVMVLLPAVALTFGLARIAARTLLMRAADPARAGAVFGATNAFGLGYAVVSMVVVGLVADRSGIVPGYLLLAALIAGTALMTTWTLRTRTSGLRDDE
ncbi:MFS transporter [Longispora albida]|uniref:MFS transporter n=1 Tax=Longispora albida TaxID=203523 RepID=UPI00036C9881|nr:MFS transporter [Longispora albida]